MFGIFSTAMAVFVLFLVPETKQMTLEEIDVVFGTVSAEQRAKDVENALEDEKVKAHMDHDEGLDEEKVREERVEGKN